LRYYQQLVLEADREIQLQLAELKTAATSQRMTPTPNEIYAPLCTRPRAENMVDDQ
jgi:hypothetical protein